MPLHVPYYRRKADKVRLAGWANVVLTGVLVYMSTDVIPAMFAACIWIILIFAVTQAIGWHLDKKANRLRERAD
ncbi:MAG TPA: hypothetical protein VD867_10705 [Burkholderiales bacterium]|nr:hypothetical protein [Burkholderiales bacterium]